MREESEYLKTAVESQKQKNHVTKNAIEKQIMLK